MRSRVAGCVQVVTKEEFEVLRRGKSCRLVQYGDGVAHGWPASKRRLKARAHKWLGVGCQER